MFTLGIPKRDYRRATQVLGYESAEEIPYNATLQDDGFYIFTFPEVGDEYSFRKIANRLKSEGIRIIGADAQLTEKKIMKLASLINLEPLEEMDINDPALMRARAAKDQMNQMKSNPRISFDQVLDLRITKRDLEKKIANKYREMQNDPDIEPEGGPVADDYGDQLNRLEARLYKINKQIASYDMSEGEDEDDEQDMADVKADIASMNETTEKSWSAIDVSRKAEKEISNKEWNERTAKKLDMLKKLNDAGKFKKDFDDERLQGWVDQNYSWEKLSRQFKLNEIYSLMYENTPTSLDDESMDELYDLILKYVKDPDDAEAELDRFDDGGFDNMSDMVTSNLLRDPEYKAWYNKLHSVQEPEDLRLEPEDMDNPDEDLVIIGSGYLDIKSNFKGRPNMTNDELATLGQKVVDQLHNGDKDAAFDYITSRLEEGSCGYGPDGVPGDTPGGTKGMDADDRTRGMLRMLIKKEIAKYENK